MENINIGIAKSIVSAKLRDEFISNNTINESKNIASHFYFLMENSDVLQAQYDMIVNIENRKSINSDVLAKSYVDEHLSKLTKFGAKKINEANNKLKPFIKESDLSSIDPNKIKLYNSISNLIYETVKKSSGDADIDLIHESYEIVLDHLKNNNSNQVEDINESVVDEKIDMNMVLEIAIKKFNQKYNSLDEGQLKIINTLAVGGSNHKKEMFETLKKENLEILSAINKNGIEDKINETTQKLNQMEYNDNTSLKDVISLYELKNNLS